MCLIAFAIGASPDWPLVVAANRDERWDRPTLPLQAWQLPSGKTVWSGRDLQAGGTWLGLAEGGRVAMLTNVRSGPPELAPRSRGELVTDWLDSDEGCVDWLRRFDPGQYGGFNLVLGDLANGRWSWVSNRVPDTPSAPAAAGSASDATPDGLGQLAPGWQGCELEPGLYGLSNAALDTPWPKTVALKQALKRHLDDGARAEAAGDLLNAMLHMSPAAEAELPATGVAPEVEKRLSSAFVHAPEMGYGTRSSMLVHWNANGSLDAREWTHETAASVAPVERTGLWPLVNSRYLRIDSVAALAR